MDKITRKKIAMKLRKRPKSATHKQRISWALRGKAKSEEHKKHLSEALKKFHENLDRK